MSTNKAELYRTLSATHAARSVKAFEQKFQNISAILYELSLPYCDGLKPRFNYQRLLRLLVLDQLDRSPLPAREPHEILVRKLIELRSRGYLKVVGRGTGRFGLTLEHHLGIAPNSSKRPDFMGIELKTKHDNSLQTLFSRVPSRYTQCRDKRSLVEKHGYYDKRRNRKALYTSFNSEGDSLGFSLDVRGDAIHVVKNDVSLMEYDAEMIEEALLSKHSRTAYIALSTRRRQGAAECRVEAATYCRWASIIRFLRLADEGSIYHDLTLSLVGDRVRDHGFLWRVRPESVRDLYLASRQLDLGVKPIEKV